MSPALLQGICGTEPSSPDMLLLPDQAALPAECRFGAACRHLFSRTLTGLAGNWTASQLATFEGCLPPGAIRYTEMDASVEKSEDERLFRVEEPASGRRRAARRLARDDISQQVHTFAEFEKNSSLPGGALNMSALSSQGSPITAPTEKRQTVPGKLWNLDRLDQVDRYPWCPSLPLVA